MNFAGRNSSDYGIYVRTHRPIRPAMEQTTIAIPGLDGELDQDTGTYEMRGIAVDCVVAKSTLPELRAHIREIAAWLSRSGRLLFSDEPDKYYEGRIYDEMMLNQLATWGEWAINFKVQPFAYGKNVTLTAEGMSSPALTIPISYGGTAQAPCRIIIRNTGSKDISMLRILHRISTGGNF